MDNGYFIGYYASGNTRIYSNSLLKNESGKIYIVDWDRSLGYVIVDPFNQTKEKLTHDLCGNLKVVSDDEVSILL